MKMDVTLTEEMVYDLLHSVRNFQNKLDDLNRHLDQLEDTLEDLKYGDAFEKFNENSRAFELKFNLIDIGSDFNKLCGQREQLLRELKETYKRVFLRTSDSDNDRAANSENRFMLGQM